MRSQPALAKAAATPATGAAALRDAKAGNYDMVAKRYDPETRAVAPGPKVFDLTTAERKVKIGEKVYDLWTINNTVPGPVLRCPNHPETGCACARVYPASGSSVVELQLVGEGKFTVATHQFDHVSEGAVGLFVTGDGMPGALKPDPAMAHMAH